MHMAGLHMLARLTLLGLFAFASACTQAGAPGPGPGAADAGPDDVVVVDASIPTPTPDAGSPDASVTSTTPVADCFANAFVSQPEVSLDYDQFAPTVGSHCLGSNHQDITGIERVVFLGDSVTVGTPPSSWNQVYRATLAQQLATHFNLEAPSALWEMANPLDGTALLRDSGDFSSCAKWGARTDDLLEDSTQIVDCLPASQAHKKTLVILTMGGNDIASITKDGLDDIPLTTLWADTEAFVQKLRDAIEWIKTPGRFPNGVHVIFANMFEFTDGSGETTACPAAGLAGFGADWEDPDALADMVIYANEQFMKIAVDTGTDMAFVLENFCGHGFRSDDPTAPCYRGPNTPRWFDDTCIHPNPAGHDELTRMFMKIVTE